MTCPDMAAPRTSPGHGEIPVPAPPSAAPEQPADELRLLAVHGLLHCLGHDHDEPERAAAMTAQTRRLLPGQDVPDLAAH